MAGGQLPAILAASDPTDVPPIPALVTVGGLGLAVTSDWEALHGDRAEWEAEIGETRVVRVVIEGMLVAEIGAPEMSTP